MHPTHPPPTTLDNELGKPPKTRESGQPSQHITSALPLCPPKTISQVMRTMPTHTNPNIALPLPACLLASPPCCKYRKSTSRLAALNGKLYRAPAARHPAALHTYIHTYIQYGIQDASASDRALHSVPSPSCVETVVFRGLPVRRTNYPDEQVVLAPDEMVASRHFRTNARPRNDTTRHDSAPPRRAGRLRRQSRWEHKRGKHCAAA